MKKLMLSLVFFSFLFSCKNSPNKGDDTQESSTTEQVEKKDYIEKTFIATLSGVFTKDDTFQLLYSETESPYTGLQIVKKKIKGKTEMQDIVFTLPKGIYPYKFRLDVGANKEQGIIKINKLKLKYQRDEIIINGGDFLSYFKPNPWVSRVSSEEFKLVVKDINNGQRTVSYAPYFNATPKLINALEAL